MTKYACILVAAVMAPLAACGSTTSGTTGTGGSTSTTDATSTTTSASTGGAGGGECVGKFPPGSCTTCGEASCCAEGAACDATEGCISCVESTDPTCTAANKAEADALLSCLHTSCEAACFPTPPPPVDVTCTVPAPLPLAGSCVTVGGAIECNPITNELCDTANGEACDLKGDGYHCYPGPNAKNLCDTCGPTGNMGQCKGGSTCLPGPDGKCGKFCCSDAECGAGKCNKMDMLPAGVGYCVGGNP